MPEQKPQKYSLALVEGYGEIVEDLGVGAKFGNFLRNIDSNLSKPEVSIPQIVPERVQHTWRRLALGSVAVGGVFTAGFAAGGVVFAHRRH